MSQGHISLIYCNMKQLDFFNILEQTKPICPVCGNGFEKTRSNHIYCSSKCNLKSYYEKNKDKKLKKTKERYLNNRDHCLEIGRRWKSENKDYKKEWYKKNKDKLKESARAYREANRDKIKKYINNKYKTNPSFKLRSILSTRIKIALKGAKNNNTVSLLGCTVKEAREHLEKQFKEGMSWENHNYNGWHIDHIIPCASFDLTDPEQQKKCFHYTNLQPLWAEENLSKGTKIL